MHIPGFSDNYSNGTWTVSTGSEDKIRAGC
ncbi:hypothetical protein TRIHO_09600 [Tritonibacter horizontis]|uniref:Uncharacterized protein n=1 Tax=Tritonibacter horizontis TaxID=1768241 RepID=A0A132C0W5_9RHOB|nr:hypothetical protein TRIHO_09600 [Tritonibacter horizontis]